MRLIRIEQQDTACLEETANSNLAETGWSRHGEPSAAQGAGKPEQSAGAHFIEDQPIHNKTTLRRPRPAPASQSNESVADDEQAGSLQKGALQQIHK